MTLEYSHSFCLSLVVEQRLVNLLSAGVSNVSYATNESSDSGEESFLSPMTTSQRLTTAPPPNRSSAHSGRYRHQPLPRRHASNQDESLSTAFITPGPANFFVGSLSGTTDNTNVSGRSLVEDLSDIETIDDDAEEMHSVLASSESNAGFVNDEDSATSNVTRIQL